MPEEPRPAAIEAPPNAASATGAWRVGGTGRSCICANSVAELLRHGGALREKMYEKVREASRQHPLRWNEYLLRPSANRFVWFRLLASPGYIGATGLSAGVEGPVLCSIFTDSTFSREIVV